MIVQRTQVCENILSLKIYGCYLWNSSNGSYYLILIVLNKNSKFIFLNSEMNSGGIIIFAPNSQLQGTFHFYLDSFLSSKDDYENTKQVVDLKQEEVPSSHPDVSYYRKTPDPGKAQVLFYRF